MGFASYLEDIRDRAGNRSGHGYRSSRPGNRHRHRHLPIYSGRRRPPDENYSFTGRLPNKEEQDLLSWIRSKS